MRQRPQPLVGRLRLGEPCLGVPGRPDAPRQLLDRLLRCLPVRGHLGGQRVRVGGQRPRQPSVLGRCLAGHQHPQHGLAQQGVSQLHRARAVVRAEQPTVPQLAEGRGQPGLVELGGRGDHGVRQAAPRDPQRPCDAPAALVELAEAGDEHVLEQGRQVLPARARELLGEQGQPPATGVDPVHHRGRDLAADHLDLLGARGAVQRLQRQHRDVRAALHPTEPLHPGGGDIRVVGAPGDDGRDTWRPGHEVLQQVQRGVVGPVQVLDDHRERVLLRHRHDERGDGRVEAGARPLVVGVVLLGQVRHLGQQPCHRRSDVRRAAAQRLGHPPPSSTAYADRRMSAIGSSGTSRVSGRQDPSRMRVVARGQLGGALDEPGLAHAGLTADEEHAGPALRMASNDPELGPTSGEAAGRRRDVGSRPRDRSHPQVAHRGDVTAHRLDQQLHGSPGGEPGGREDVRHRRVGAADLGAQLPQARPAGPAVQLVQRLHEVVLGAAGQVRTGECAHHRPPSSTPSLQDAPPPRNLSMAFAGGPDRS